MWANSVRRLNASADGANYACSFHTKTMLILTCVWERRKTNLLGDQNPHERGRGTAAIPSGAPLQLLPHLLLVALGTSEDDGLKETAMRAFLILLAFSVFVLANTPSRGAIVWHPWCARYHDGSAATICVFDTPTQCLADVRRVGGFWLEKRSASAGQHPTEAATHPAMRRVSARQ